MGQSLCLNLIKLSSAIVQLFNSVIADLHDRGDYRSASGNSPHSRKFLPPPSPDRVGVFETKKRAPWHRTISPFRSKVSAAQSKTSSLSQPLPIITVSSPDIVSSSTQTAMSLLQFTLLQRTIMVYM